jgi:hypothetical protein
MSSQGVLYADPDTHITDTDTCSVAVHSGLSLLP